MFSKGTKWLPAALVALALMSSASVSQAGAVPAPAAMDKCAVCGMFVAKYPAWTASAGFNDLSSVFFDGPKDLFAYLLDTRKYNPSKSSKTVTAVRVKDYYTLKVIDGQTAFYVLGSDVYGPMGGELVPFEKEDDARVFLGDHKGRRVLRFKDITPDVIKSLE